MIAGADDFSLNGEGLALRVGTSGELNGLAFELLQHGVLVDDAGIVILLGDLEDGFASGIAEDDGVGFELAGDVGGGDLIGAGGEVEVDGGASDGEVLVIDGEGDGCGSALLG